MLGIFIFLIALGIIWLIFATISDLRTTEIPNWLNFSLAIFALGARFFYSAFNDDWGIFIQGAIWFAIFFAIANALYFIRFFGGGDARLMASLGAVIPFGAGFQANLDMSLQFLLLFYITMTLFSLANIFYLGFRDSEKIKKKFMENIKSKKKIFFIFMAAGLAFMAMGLMNNVLFMLGVLVFAIPYLFYYTKSIDDISLLKKISPEYLTEGDMLYHGVRIGGKIIKPATGGLSRKEIAMLRKRNAKVWIKTGVPFTSVFLLSFLLYSYLYAFGINLWNSLW
jgi:Flp pilus assembly protein protease CpaA